MNKSPVVLVKEKFGDKAALVTAVQKLATDELWLGRTNEDKGLAHVSNAKLLRLHRILSDVKEKFGTRAKLIDAISEMEKRVKDDGYKARLGKFPVPRLWDMYRSAQKRTAPKAAKVKVEAKAAKGAPAPAKKAAATSGGKAPAKKAASGSKAPPAAKAVASKKSAPKKKG